MSDAAHMISLDAELAALYSASVDDNATIDWSLLRKITGPFAKYIVIPLVDFLTIIEPPNRSLSTPSTEAEYIAVSTI